jgi:hypothetical protein
MKVKVAISHTPSGHETNVGDITYTFGACVMPSSFVFMPGTGKSKCWGYHRLTKILEEDITKSFLDFISYKTLHSKQRLGIFVFLDGRETRLKSVQYFRLEI